MGIWDAVKRREFPSFDEFVDSGRGLYSDAADTVYTIGGVVADGAGYVADTAVDIGHAAYGFGERAVDMVGDGIDTIGDGIVDIYHYLTSPFYEGRDGRNNRPEDPSSLPKEVGVTDENCWTRLSQWMARYHQDESVEGEEIKYVHCDGSEYITYQDGSEVTRDDIRGSYNYVNPGVWEGDLENKGIPGALEWGARAIGHGITDVIPWYLGGNVRGDG